MIEPADDSSDVGVFDTVVVCMRTGAGGMVMLSVVTASGSVLHDWVCAYWMASRCVDSAVSVLWSPLSFAVDASVTLITEFGCVDASRVGVSTRVWAVVRVLADSMASELDTSDGSAVGSSDVVALVMLQIFSS